MPEKISCANIRCYFNIPNVFTNFNILTQKIKLIPYIYRGFFFLCIKYYICNSKIVKKTMENNIQFNEHNKQEYPPMHTAEHLLNATMVKMFNCGRAVSAHVERKKSKCDYALLQELTPEQIAEVEAQVNKVISMSIPVTEEMITIEEAKAKFDTSRLPEGVSDIIRIINIGDYDSCPCLGLHVKNTSEIGKFKIISSGNTPSGFRIRFKLEE